MIDKLKFNVWVIIFLSVFNCVFVVPVRLQRSPVKEEDRIENVNKQQSAVTEKSVGSNDSVDDISKRNEAQLPVWSNRVNSTTVIEGFVVFAGLSAAIVLYFTLKAIRLRRRRCRVRKYGILTSREDVEMTPLGEEDDDEESTVFDINDHSRP